MRPALTSLMGVIAILLPAAAGNAGPRPSLVVTHFAPVTVAGSAFKANELVVVTVVSGTSKHARRVRAGATGRFRVRFEVRAPTGCRGRLAVSALGASGSRATARLPRPQCPPDGPAA